MGGALGGGTLSFLVVAAYNGSMTKNGQTPGRRMAGTRLVSERTGQPLEGTPALLRSFTHIVDNAPLGLGWLAPLVTTKRQTFADMIHGTVVVDAKEQPVPPTPQAYPSQTYR